MSELERAVLRRLRLRHIELLTVLSELPTVRGAARRLNLSQPAVSKMLREIEAAFGARLFERSPTGVAPNALGQALIHRARVIRSEVAVAREELDELRAGGGGLLRIGTFSITAVVPAAIVQLRREEPQLAVRITEAAVRELLEKLMAGDLDCVFGALAPQILDSGWIGELVSEVVREDRVSVVASERHRLARSRRLQWKDLAGERWVLQPPGSLVRRAFMAAYFDQGLTPPAAAVETMSPITMAALIELDPGLIGAMRAENVPLQRGRGPLAVLPVSPVAPLPPLAVFSRKTRDAPSPMVERFIRAARTASASKRGR